MRTVIKNGLVVTEKGPEFFDIVIEDEIICELAENIELKSTDKIIDAGKRVVFPGGIDPHTHLAMPFNGTITDDDWKTGTRAAALGGTTTILDFCLGNSESTIQQAIDKWHENAKDAYIDYGFHLNVTKVTEKDIEGIRDICKREGITSIKLFLSYADELATTDRDLFKVSKLAADEDWVVMVHCENGLIIDELVQEELKKNHVEPRYHYLTRPDNLEAESTKKVIDISKITGNTLYVVHVTSEKAMREIQRGRVHAKNRIFAETCEQYLVLDDSKLEQPGFEGAKYVWSPPLRKQQDINYLWESIKNDSINTIGSDHCSFNFNGKKRLGIDDFSKIPNGGPFIEDRFSLIYSEFVMKRGGSLKAFVDIISTNAAKIFGLYPKKGVIKVGADADLVIFNPNVIQTISVKEHHMNVDYNPFEGMVQQGKVETVFLRGKELVQNGEFVAKSSEGHYLKR